MTLTMKKLIFSLLLLSLCSMLSAVEPDAFAEENSEIQLNDDTKKGLIRDWNFAPLQLGVGLDSCTNLVDENSNTIFTFGLLYMKQKSAVFSFSACSQLRQNYGLQLGLLEILAKKNHGIMAALVNGSFDGYGIKFGLINFKGKFDQGQLLGVDFADLFYVGLIHLDCPVSIGLANLADNTAYCQIGALNGGSKGVQIGLGNIDGDWQFGLFNYCDQESSSWKEPSEIGTFQFGLLNYNNKSYLPWLPLINFDMGR